jgi:hypothetical protein
VGDHLGDHRVVEGLISSPLRTPLSIRAPSSGKRKVLQRADGGQKALRRIFRVKPRLEGPAVEGKLFLRLRQRICRRRPELPFDEVLPVISSVTGCSTWRRVFISMK